VADIVMSSGGDVTTTISEHEMAFFGVVAEVWL
jgi:hypothetical protein